MIKNRLLLPRKLKKIGQYLLLAFSVIWLGPALACGSFAPRPTPEPTPLPAMEGQVDELLTENTQPSNGQGGESAVQPQAPIGTPTLPPSPTPLPGPTPTFTPTPLPGTALSIGQPARLTAPNGLNVRDAPNTSGTRLARLGTGLVVTVIDGPVSADDFTWWKIDDGSGNVGWSADGDGTTEWISPRIGEPQPVDRRPAVGDRIVVTTPNGQQLTIRSFPSTGAPKMVTVDQGREYTITAGPQDADNYTWYRIRSDDGSIEGWAAGGNDDGRWLSPLE